MQPKGPKVTNKPVTAADDDPQEEAKAVNKPARETPKDERPEAAQGDPDSIAAWNRRKAEEAAIAARKAIE